MMYYERERKPKPPLDYKSALQKAADYCAYQERSQQQVRDKLYDYGLHHDEVEEAISELITQGFINEERFARAYVRGKFRMRGWGRNKIRQGIRQHKISDYCLRKGFEEINPEAYYEKLLEHTEKKYRSISANSEYIIKGKLTQHLMGKGFEGDLIREAIEEVLSKGEK